MVKLEGCDMVGHPMVKVVVRRHKDVVGDLGEKFGRLMTHLIPPWQVFWGSLPFELAIVKSHGVEEGFPFPIEHGFKHNLGSKLHQSWLGHDGGQQVIVQGEDDELRPFAHSLHPLQVEV